MIKIRRFLICLVIALTISCCLAGCNTIEGTGKDIQQGGKAIEDAAD